MPRPATAATASSGFARAATTAVAVPGYARSTASFRAFIFTRMREGNLLPPLDMDSAEAEAIDEEKPKAKSLFQSTADDGFWDECDDMDGSLQAEINSEPGLDDIRHVYPPPVCRGMRRVVLANPFVNVGCFPRLRKVDGLCTRKRMQWVRVDLAKLRID
jgi:hypothetical protein